MDLSGVIFVVLALAWAVYLIPKTLKHHDEVARTRSIDRFSGAMRVLAHREPGDDRDARLVVRPSAPQVPGRPAADPAPVAASAPAHTAPSAPARPTVSVTVAPATSRERVAARRAAARTAARRRRRVLTLLLACDLVVLVTALLGVLPTAVVAVPVVLTLVWLVLCRTQIRHETGRDARVLTARPQARPVAAMPGDVEEVVLVEDVVAAVATAHCGTEDGSEDGGEDTVGVPIEELREALATRAAEQVASHLPGVTDEEPLEILVEDPGTLWDPLPVTLPTYVGKDKARRTVRTIDLGEPGTWTSGRTAEDAEIAARATDPAEAAEQTTADGRRVVGG